MPTKSLLGPCTQFQLEPFGYPVFWEITRSMRDNTWTPEEIPVGADISDYAQLKASGDQYDQSKLHWFNSIWGQLTAFDMLRSEDATTLLTMLLQPEEVKHFLIRLAWEERLHTEAYRYVIQNLGLPETGKDSIYELWMHVPEMKARVEYAEQENKIVLDVYRVKLRAEENANDPDYSIYGKQALLRSLVFWFLIFEKVWFLINLSGPVQQIARTHNEFSGAAEQLWYIARDETLHIRGGVELIRAFTAEHPEVITDDFLSSIQKMYEECLDLEAAYCNYSASVSPLVGYSIADHNETARFFANLGARASGFIPDPFPGAKHRFPWMSEVMEGKKETNFFEKKVKEYRTGAGLDWGESPEDVWEEITWDAGMYDHLNGDL